MLNPSRDKMKARISVGRGRSARYVTPGLSHEQQEIAGDVFGKILYTYGRWAVSYTHLTLPTTPYV